MDPQIIYATQEDSAIDICERIGIVTTQLEKCKATWMYKGKVYPRPEIHNFEAKLLEYFNIKIEYHDKDQLKMF